MNVPSTLLERAVRARQRAGRGIDARIFFLHMPKCGGTSIDRAIRGAYGRRRWARPSPLVRLDPVASKAAATLCGDGVLDYRERLLLYFMGQRHLRYIGGHFNYSETAYRAFGDRWNFVTVLRHPVKRWFSKYYFNRYKAGAHYKLEEDLETFMASVHGQALGCDYVDKFTKGIPLTRRREAAAVEAALASLRTFALVGVLEDLGRFGDQFDARFGERLYFRKTNTNPAPVRKLEAETSEPIRQEVERICAPDLRIYHAALGGELAPGAP